MANDAVADDASEAHLSARLSVLESRVQTAMETRLQRTGGDDEALRGLYLRTSDMLALFDAGSSWVAPTSDEAELFLDRIESEVDASEAAGAVTRLRALQRSFSLDPMDMELLLLAAAPDLDVRFEQFYAYLHDDVTQRRATVGLALRLAGASPLAGRDRGRLGAGGRLIRSGLITVEDAARPFLSRVLRVPDRVTGHLVGDDVPDPSVEALLGTSLIAEVGDHQVLTRAIASGSRLCYVLESRGSAGYTMAAAALAAAGLRPVQLDLRRLPGGPVDAAIVRAAAREAVLLGGALVAGPVEQLTERGIDAIRLFAELPCITVLVGSRTWDTAWSREVPFITSAPVASRAERTSLWRDVLEGGEADTLCDDVLADFRLTPAQMVGALACAQQSARAHDRAVTTEDLRRGARSQNAAGLEHLAQRIEPSVGWDDLVLPPAVLRGLQELTTRCRYRETVFDDWRIGGPASRRQGTIALFSGPPGTGKTMAADVVAGEFGLNLYVINLATVVDKYIGETEKNLDRIFTEAEQVNGLLFFDEADALFGKRSEVKDARDRYANIEVAYLLQRLERFDGIALLATNLRTNIDEAFNRRLDASIEFPNPDATSRRILWSRSLGSSIPRDEIDLDFLAKSFEFSGGNIRNITVAAAFFAAERRDKLRMADLIKGTYREYRKLGRLCSASDFGPYAALLESA